MRFNKTSKYALRIMNRMVAGKEQLIKAGELQVELDMPEKYLRKILTQLVSRGLLKSIQGRNGGFMLARPANNISLYSIINAVGSFDTFDECMLGYDSCAFEVKCSFHEIWANTKEKFINSLKITSLADVSAKDSKSLDHYTFLNN